MKNKILSSVLIFMFTWVAVGALDCGCAFAAPLDSAVQIHKAAKASEGMDCHSSGEAQSKKAEDVCCSGCQLESKAPVPPNVIVTGPSLNNLSQISLNILKSTAVAVVSAIESSGESSRFPDDPAHSVSFYNTPIYLAVQSFLI